MRERLINDHERQRVESALKEHAVFSALTESERSDLLGSVVSLDVRAGDVMFSEEALPLLHADLGGGDCWGPIHRQRR